MAATVVISLGERVRILCETKSGECNAMGSDFVWLCPFTGPNDIPEETRYILSC